MTKTDTLGLVTDRFARARDHRLEHQDDQWERNYNNYKGILDSSKFPWRSKLFIPWSFTIVETIIPRLFARDPKWRPMAGNPDFPQDAPKTIGDLLDYQWRNMGMRLKMYDYLKDSLMYSKGFAKVGWDFRKKNYTIQEPVVGDNDEVTFEEKVVNELEYDDPTVDIVDPIDVYVDPDATSSGYGGDNKYLIHRKTVPREELEENPNYKNVDQIDKESNANEYLDKRLRTRDMYPPEDKYKNLVEILEYWEKDRLVVVANQGVVLRDTPNPYSHKEIPFVELDDYRDPHLLYGESELSVVDPLQREINSIRNQRRDYDNLALNPPIRMIPGALRNPNSAIMAPGSVWQVSDLGSMDTFQLPILQGVSTDIEIQTAEDIKRTVAIDEIGIGLLPDNPQRRSATEVRTSQNSAGKRFAMKTALLEEAVKKIGQLVFALDQQFLSERKIIHVVGERGATEWVDLGPEDIRGNWFIDIETSSMLPKDEVAQREEAVELLQYINPLIGPVVQTNPSVLRPIMKMIMQTFDIPGQDQIMEEVSEVLTSAEQRSQQQQTAQNAQGEADVLNRVQEALQGSERATEQEIQPNT